MIKIDKVNLSIYILIAISVFSKILGFGRDIVLANIYGTSYMADVFMFALTIPDFFFEMISNTVIIGFIPIMSKLVVEKDNDALNIFYSGTIKWAFWVSLAFTVFVLIFSDFLTSSLAPGFSNLAHELSNSFLKIIILSLLFKSIVSVFAGFLNVKNIFIPPAWNGIIFDVFVIVSIILSKNTSSYILPIFVVLSSIFQLVLMYFYVKRENCTFILSAPIFTDNTKSMLKNVIPALFSVSVLQVSTIVNRALSTNILEGGISYLNYSSKMSYFSENIIVASICTVLYPTLTRSFASKDLLTFSESLVKAVRKAIFFLVPITVILFLLSEPIIELLFKRGSFTSENVIVTSKLMQLNLIGILGIGLQAIFTRTLYAMRKIKVVIYCSLTLLLMNIMFSVILSNILGIYGIAVSMSLAYMIGCLIYFFMINHFIKKICYSKIVIYLFKVLICSLIAGLCIYLNSNIIYNELIVYILTSLLASIIGFFISAKVMKII